MKIKVIVQGQIFERSHLARDFRKYSLYIYMYTNFTGVHAGIISYTGIEAKCIIKEKTEVEFIFYLYFYSLLLPVS